MEEAVHVVVVIKIIRAETATTTTIITTDMGAIVAITLITNEIQNSTINLITVVIKMEEVIMEEMAAAVVGIQITTIVIQEVKMAEEL